jgi:CheY-like chemotaxis protein
MPITLPTPKFRRYHTLMPHRMQEVLLVSSMYQAFILQQDGDIEDQVFFEYKALSLSSAPTFTHVTTGAEALAALRERRFDLVLVANQLPDMDVRTFGQQVKSLRYHQPLVILAFHPPSAQRLMPLVGDDGYDAVFVWNGNARIMLAIIKYLEDRDNVDPDIAEADVGVILLIEESPDHTSAFLSALYPALMRQSRSLFSEGLNRVQKLLRMRTRPKVLHAVSWEQAQQIYDRYADNLFAVISEVGFREGGVHDPEAGIRFARQIRADRGDLPVLLQSGDDAQLQRARQVATVTVDRRSPRLLAEIRRFLIDHLGFGDFVFILPDGTEVDRAKDIKEFARKLSVVPDESLRFHATRNHLSVWLMARSEFTLARKLKRLTLDDFQSMDAVREFLIAELDALQRRSRQGVIRDADPDALDPDSRFQRLGSGSLGGKARGIAFLDQLFSGDEEDAQVSGLPLRIPRSVALTTDAFDEFVEDNHLDRLLAENAPDPEVCARFREGRLPAWVQDSLGAVVDRLRYPLAVRSSSLLEDSLMYPFAGIYTTVMLPNSAEDDAVRLQELELAVKHVFASTYCENARAYLANTSRSIEEEKMGVLIQQLVGQRFDSRFYPHFAGVARSHNFYPVAPQRPEDGVAQLVLGLGGIVVEGGKALRFSPRHPRQLPGSGQPRQMLKASQSYFYALDLTLRLDPDHPDLDANPRRYPLEVAVEDGTIKPVGSVYDAANDRVVEDPSLDGPWLITFNNLLAHEAIPLAEALSELLELTETALGTHVEVELACDMGDWGRRLPRHRGHQARRSPTLYLLQVRPALVHSLTEGLDLGEIPHERLICRSESALGHGRFADLRDVVYVRRDTFDPAQSPRIAQEIGELNARLQEAGRGYVLLGPGRWGSSDPWLGIPVQWAQIAGARIIVEASPEGFNVDPSQGAHFFHNITALGIGYLTVPPGATRGTPRPDGFVDWGWLDEQPARTETGFLRHVRLEQPLQAVLDGRDSRGVLARPSPG